MPVHDDRKIFEFLLLETMQAGLSWLTILRKRESFRQAFDNFDPEAIANYDPGKKELLMGNSGIVRNRLKIEAATNNAKRYLEVQEEFGTFDSYVWGLFGGKAKKNKWASVSQIPPKSGDSDMLSIELKSRGFKFVGSTICYSHMQASGLVNDHVTSCFRYSQV